MGHALKRTIYRLTFEDPELADLSVRVRSLNVGQMLEATELSRLDDDKLPVQEKLAAMGELFDVFASALVDWNLEEEDGTAIPATLAGIKTLESAFLMDVIRTWITATAGVAAPLAQPSAGGSPSLVASMPMETLSLSQAS